MKHLMNNFKHLTIILLLTILQGACSSNSISYTLMTYNIRHGVGMDRVLDLERTAKVIETCEPDIVVLNEVDTGTARSNRVFQTDSLGNRLGMHSAFGRSINYDGGEYGNALLSKYPILDFRIIDLSSDTLLEGRSVFVARLDLGEDTLLVMGTHLGLQIEERRKQIDMILQHLPNSHKFILAGDFNLESDSENYATVIKYLQDGVKLVNPQPNHTFPADAPTRRIDYIFLGSGLEAVRIPPITLDELSVASDHRPQILEFVIH